jgi:hypothetical protein
MPLPQPTIPYNPQTANPLESYGRIVSLRNLLQAGTATQQENELRALQLNDQKILRSSAQGIDWKQPDAFDAFLSNAQQQGVSPQTLSQMALQRQQYMEQTAKTDIETNKLHLARNNQLLGHIDAIRAATNPLQRAQVARAQAAQILQQKLDAEFDPQTRQVIQAVAQGKYIPDDATLDLLGGGLLDHNSQIESKLKATQTAEAEAKTREANASAGVKEAQTKAFEGMGLVPGLSPDEQSLISYMRSVKGAKPENYPAWKAQQEAKSTQPYKLQLAIAEGKARQLIQGLGEPVYAIDQSGQKTLMSKTDAIQGGIRTMLPVTEKQLSDDTMLINRLGDVRQKIARYEQSLQQPISYFDKSRMGALLDTQKLRVGAFGTEFPVGRFDAMLTSEDIQKLSPAARDQLIAYRNAREALVGYNRVLSGSGKSSDKALELQEQTLPDPSTTDPDFSNRAITQFKENLRIVGQGLPKIPGIKSPEEWEKEITAPAVTPKPIDYKPLSHMRSLSSLLLGAK